MTQKSKAECEIWQAERFLAGLINFDKLESIIPDPPDVRVWAGGKAILELELTEYHRSADRVARSKRWLEEIWPKIDELRKNDPSLINVLADIVFFDINLPRYDKNKTYCLLNELILLAKTIGSHLKIEESLKISFTTRIDAIRCPVIQNGWHFLPKEDWPYSAVCLNRIEFTKKTVKWPGWFCHQATTDRSSPDSQRIRDIIDEKDSKLRRADHRSSGNSSGIPVFLILICDLGDASSHIFPGNDVPGRLHRNLCPE